MSQAVCRCYQPGDEVGIQALYRDVFGVEVSPQAWEWAYLEVPDGPAVIVVAEKNGEIIGHYAIQPRPFWCADISCRVGLTVGTMVHPAHRNFTTFVEMAQLAYEECRQRQVKFLYTLSRDDAWRVRQAVLDWQALPPPVEWDGPFNPSIPWRGSGVTIKRMVSGQQLPTLDWRKVFAVRERMIGGCRSVAWLTWRFLRKPGAEYVLFLALTARTVLGYTAIKHYVRGQTRYGHVLDWQIACEADEAVANSMWGAVWHQFDTWKVQRVSCWALPASTMSSRVERLGLSPTGRQTNFGYLSLDSEVAPKLSDASAWDIQMADSDVY